MPLLPEKISLHASTVPGNRSKTHARTKMSLIFKIVTIVYSLQAGIVLLWLPWQSIWENNYLLYLHPQLRPLIADPFFKGAVLGLGIANIMIGFYEIMHFKSIPKGCFSR
jgi:magnesium-transporting ATPase (P-type)